MVGTIGKPVTRSAALEEGHELEDAHRVDEPRLEKGFVVRERLAVVAEEE